MIVNALIWFAATVYVAGIVLWVAEECDNHLPANAEALAAAVLDRLVKGGGVHR